MSKVRLTDISGCQHVVNSDLILCLRDDGPRFNDDDNTVVTAVVMPDDLTIYIEGTIDQAIEKLRWRV